MDRDAIVKALVKPLVWRDTKSTNQRHEAVIFEAMYEVCLEDDGWFFWNDGDEGYGPYNTLAAAQAAAEADYRARIADALHIDKIAALVDLLNEPVATHRNEDWLARRHAALAAFHGDATGGEVG